MEHFLPENSGAVTSAKNFQNNSIPLNPKNGNNPNGVGEICTILYYYKTHFS